MQRTDSCPRAPGQAAVNSAQLWGENRDHTMRRGEPGRGRKAAWELPMEEVGVQWNQASLIILINMMQIQTQMQM